jgi:DNA (cytosine-5)-methyltransferase 3A
MNILSLFDGMSCGQIALNKLGIKYNNYFACEIDKYAIQTAQKNYPNTQQLGDVTKLDATTLPKIDLLIGGSPCQGFSFAGKMKGMSTKSNIEIHNLDQYLKLKEEEYQFDGQSYLFWEYMRILDELRTINRNVKFLLENVKMKKSWEEVLNKAIGVKPIMINSSLVSAQNRRRLYWTNIGIKPIGLFGNFESVIQQPQDKGILLKDILDDNVDEKYYVSNKILNYLNKNNQIHKENDNVFTDNFSIDYKYASIRYGRTEEAKQIRRENMKNGKDYTPFQKKEIVGLDFEKMNTLTTSPNKDNLVYHNSIREIKVRDNINTYLNSENDDFKIIDGYSCRVIDNKKIGTITQHMSRSSLTNGFKIINKNFIRRLTPIECERLQTVPDNYTEGVSNTQRYKMLGNGWTVDVIAHILKNIEL